MKVLDRLHHQSQNDLCHYLLHHRFLHQQHLVVLVVLVDPAVLVDLVDQFHLVDLADQLNLADPVVPVVLVDQQLDQHQSNLNCLNSKHISDHQQLQYMHRRLMRHQEDFLQY